MLSKVLLLTATVEAAKLKGKCPFGYTSGNKPGLGDKELLQIAEARYPSEILVCPSDQKAFTTVSLTKAQYEGLANEVIDQMKKSGDEMKYAACLLRLEGHDLMDFRRVSTRRGAAKLSGGSDGCINFHDDDNAGLPECLAWSSLNTIYESHCDKISLADFMVLAAEAVVGGLADDSRDFSDRQSLLAKFRDQFRFGRETLEQCPHNVGLMPNPEKGCEDLKAVFLEHIFHVKGFGGKNGWKAIAAISGAHTIGSAKPGNSGYDGMWGDPKNQGIFNNDYFRNMVAHGWGPKRAVGGNEDKNQWVLIDKSSQEEKDRQMMLNSDMCLFSQSNTLHSKCMDENGRVKGRTKCKDLEKKGVFLNAKNDSCCAWMQHRHLMKIGVIANGKEDYCGLSDPDFFALHNQRFRQAEIGDRLERMRPECCADERPDSFGDCDSFRWPKGPAIDAVLHFAKDLTKFYIAYREAWKMATENGWVLHDLE